MELSIERGEEWSVTVSTKNYHKNTGIHFLCMGLAGYGNFVRTLYWKENVTFSIQNPKLYYLLSSKSRGEKNTNNKTKADSILKTLFFFFLMSFNNSVII